MDNDTNEFEKLTYDLAKVVTKLTDIKNRMEYLVNKNEWDGLFLLDFSEALEKLANVEGGAIVYSLEEKYRNSDIHEMKRSLDAYEER